MPEDKLPIIPHSGSGLVQTGSQGGRIVAEMVSGALALSRNNAALAPRFTIGEHVFCEPDYQQILLWEKALELRPEEVVERLLTEPENESKHYNKTQFANGRIIQIYWHIGAFPLVSFEWVDGLVIKEIAFFVPEDQRWVGGSLSLIRSFNAPAPQPVERSLSLPLLQLRRLDCSRMGLVSLDLISVSKLTRLSCTGNRITALRYTGWVKAEGILRLRSPAIQ